VFSRCCNFASTTDVRVHEHPVSRTLFCVRFCRFFPFPKSTACSTAALRLTAHIPASASVHKLRGGFHRKIKPSRVINDPLDLMNRLPLTPITYRSRLRSAPFPRELRFRRCRSGNFRLKRRSSKRLHSSETECLPLQEPFETAFRPRRRERVNLPAGKFWRDLFFTDDFEFFPIVFTLGLPPEYHRPANLPLVFHRDR